MKHFLVFLLLSQVFFLVSCDDDAANDGSGAPVPVQPADSADAGPYFPGADEWESQNPLQIKWDTSYLAQAIKFAQSKNSYSFLIVHEGRIVSENYWQNSTVDSLHHLESVAKSMVAFVVGVLQEKGQLKITEKVSHYLGDGWSRAPVKNEQKISVRDLLSMSSGLDYRMEYLATPGEIWYYSHEAFTMLFKVIEAAAAKPFPTVFEELLFSKIGITKYQWDGTSLLMNSRDMVRFGLLIINNGKWKNEQLLGDEQYFKDMLSPSQSIQKAYGYLWWLNGQSDYYNDKAIDDNIYIPGPIFATMPADGRLAMGHFDQRIEVIPSLKLIVVRQGGDTALPELGEGSFDYQLWDLLTKAVKAKELGG